jgi:hypothetical protein
MSDLVEWGHNDVELGELGVDGRIVLVDLGTTLTVAAFLVEQHGAALRLALLVLAENLSPLCCVSSEQLVLRAAIAALLL